VKVQSIISEPITYFYQPVDILFGEGETFDS